MVFSTALALGLIWYVALRADSPVVLQLSGTTSLLLLVVFTVVNVACLVLRRASPAGLLPLTRATPRRWLRLLCLFLVGPWVDRDPLQWKIAGVLLGIGVVLWAFTWFTNRGIRAKKTGFRDIDHLGG